MMPKFRNGDIVYNWLNEKYRIIRSLGKNKKITYEVEEVKTKKKYNFDEDELSFNKIEYGTSKPSESEFKPSTPRCPRCNTPWTVSGFGAKKWYDCLNCKNTSENLSKLLNLKETKDIYVEDDWNWLDSISKRRYDDDDTF